MGLNRVYSMFIQLITLSCILIYVFASYKCFTDNNDLPLELSPDLSLMSGDIINFRTVVGDSVGYIEPIITPKNINNDCAIIPVSLASNPTSASQFMVVPVAVVDKSISQSIMTSNGLNSTTSPTIISSSQTNPQLISTIQLVHILTGRILGSKRCQTSETKCNDAEPILLPLYTGTELASSRFCHSSIDSYNTIWDLESHEPSQTVRSALLQKFKQLPIELYPLQGSLPQPSLSSSIHPLTPRSQFSPFSSPKNDKKFEPFSFASHDYVKPDTIPPVQPRTLPSSLWEDISQRTKADIIELFNEESYRSMSIMVEPIDQCIDTKADEADDMKLSDYNTSSSSSSISTSKPTLGKYKTKVKVASHDKKHITLYSSQKSQQHMSLPLSSEQPNTSHQQNTPNSTNIQDYRNQTSAVYNKREQGGIVQSYKSIHSQKSKHNEINTNIVRDMDKTTGNTSYVYDSVKDSYNKLTINKTTGGKTVSAQSQMAYKKKGRSAKNKNSMGDNKPNNERIDHASSVLRNVQRLYDESPLHRVFLHFPTSIVRKHSNRNEEDTGNAFSSRKYTHKDDSKTLKRPYIVHDRLVPSLILPAVARIIASISTSACLSGVLSSIPCDQCVQDIQSYRFIDRAKTAVLIGVNKSPNQNMSHFYCDGLELYKNTRSFNQNDEYSIRYHSIEESNTMKNDNRRQCSIHPSYSIEYSLLKALLRIDNIIEHGLPHHHVMNTTNVRLPPNNIENNIDLKLNTIESLYDSIVESIQSELKTISRHKSISDDKIKNKITDILQKRIHQSKADSSMMLDSQEWLYMTRRIIKDYIQINNDNLWGSLKSSATSTLHTIDSLASQQYDVISNRIESTMRFNTNNPSSLYQQNDNHKENQVGTSPFLTTTMQQCHSIGASVSKSFIALQSHAMYMKSIQKSRRWDKADDSTKIMRYIYSSALEWSLSQFMEHSSSNQTHTNPIYRSTNLKHRDGDSTLNTVSAEREEKELSDLLNDIKTKKTTLSLNTTTDHNSPEYDRLSIGELNSDDENDDGQLYDPIRDPLPQPTFISAEQSVPFYTKLNDPPLANSESISNPYRTTEQFADIGNGMANMPDMIDVFSGLVDGKGSMGDTNPLDIMLGSSELGEGLGLMQGLNSTLSEAWSVASRPEPWDQELNTMSRQLMEGQQNILFNQGQSRARYNSLLQSMPNLHPMTAEGKTDSNATAFIKLRTRPVGLGPEQLVKPCRGYLGLDPQSDSNLDYFNGDTIGRLRDNINPFAVRDPTSQSTKNNEMYTPITSVENFLALEASLHSNYKEQTLYRRQRHDRQSLYIQPSEEDIIEHLKRTKMANSRYIPTATDGDGLGQIKHVDEHCSKILTRDGLIRDNSHIHRPISSIIPKHDPIKESCVSKKSNTDDTISIQNASNKLSIPVITQTGHINRNNTYYGSDISKGLDEYYSTLHHHIPELVDQLLSKSPNKMHDQVSTQDNDSSSRNNESDSEATIFTPFQQNDSDHPQTNPGSNPTVITGTSGHSTADPPPGPETTPCELVRLDDGTIQCKMTSNSAPLSMDIESPALWAVSRVPFASVPSSSLFLAESMTHLNYDVDFATVATFPFTIAQSEVHNRGINEYALSVRSSKRIFTAQIFRFLIAFEPAFGFSISNIPLLYNPITPLLNQLLQPLQDLINGILPGFLPDILETSAIGSGGLGITFMPGWVVQYTHTEDTEVVALYTVSAGVLTSSVGRAVANVGRTSVPFTLDITRSVHVPAGVFGTTSGSLIQYDYSVPGVYEGANVVNMEFVLDMM